VHTDVVVQQDGATAPKAEEKVRNEKVSVTDTVLQPSETENVFGSLPSVTVYFQAGTLEVTPAGAKPVKLAVKRGETRSAMAGPKAIKNTGSSELHYVSTFWAPAGRRPGARPGWHRIISCFWKIGTRGRTTFGFRHTPTNRNIHIMTA
jgi:hypothetical protein